MHSSSSSSTSNLPPLNMLKAWSPFKIDALGLVTILGSDEIDLSVGRLVESPCAEFLPLLGGFVFASNHFTAQLPGYTLYNVTDCIVTTYVKGWLVRWLRMQHFRTSTSYLTWKIEGTPRRNRWKTGLGLSIGAITILPLLVLNILMGDWFGVANTVSMITAVLVRWCLLFQQRKSLDNAIEKALHSQQEEGREEVKLLITLEDGTMVTMRAPRALVRCCFTRDQALPHPRVYSVTRWIGWLAFGSHAVVLGMASLFTQVYTVLLMLAGSLLAAYGVGCDESEISRYLKAIMHDVGDRPDERMWAYVHLDPSESEEEAMEHWSLLPRRLNVRWWNRYTAAKERRRDEMIRMGLDELLEKEFECVEKRASLSEATTSVE